MKVHNLPKVVTRMTFLGWELNPDLSIQRPTLYRLSHLVLRKWCLCATCPFRSLSPLSLYNDTVSRHRFTFIGYPWLPDAQQIEHVVFNLCFSDHSVRWVPPVDCGSVNFVAPNDIDSFSLDTISFTSSQFFTYACQKNLDYDSSVKIAAAAAAAACALHLDESCSSRQHPTYPTVYRLMSDVDRLCGDISRHFRMDSVATGKSGSLVSCCAAAAATSLESRGLSIDE